MSKYTEIIPDDIEQTLGWFLNYLKPNKKFLDVGCSTGYFGKFVKDYAGLQVDGIEISEDKAKAKNVLNNVYSFDLDSNDWPSRFTGNKYDYIFFGDVLEHLKNPLRVLEQSKKLLNKNGYIFISIPNIAHISTRLELINGSFQYDNTGILDNTHLQYFTLDTFLEIISKAKLHAVKVDYSYNDFPDKIIKQLLNRAGLNPTAKFWRIADSKEARAYQYKFVLNQNKQLKPNNVYSKLVDKPEQYRDSFIKDLQLQILALKKHADEQAKIMANQDEHIKNLQKQFATLRKICSSVKKIVKKKP